MQGIVPQKLHSTIIAYVACAIGLMMVRMVGQKSGTLCALDTVTQVFLDKVRVCIN